MVSFPDFPASWKRRGDIQWVVDIFKVSFLGREQWCNQWLKLGLRDSLLIYCIRNSYEMRPLSDSTGCTVADETLSWAWGRSWSWQDSGAWTGCLWVKHTKCYEECELGFILNISRHTTLPPLLWVIDLKWLNQCVLALKSLLFKYLSI